MSWYDRAMLGALAAACVVLVAALTVLGNRVADVAERPIPTTIVELNRGTP